MRCFITQEQSTHYYTCLLLTPIWDFGRFRRRYIDKDKKNEHSVVHSLEKLRYHHLPFFLWEMQPSAKRRGRPPKTAASIAGELDKSDDFAVTVSENPAIGGNDGVQDDNDRSTASSRPISSDVALAFLPPSISLQDIFQGNSYTFHSQIPRALNDDSKAPVTLGVDEAGRGPVLGPMVYGVAYCLSPYEKSLSSAGFDDSKKLTTDTRTKLMQDICSPMSNINANVGWAVRIMSARDISSAMLRPTGVGPYNLNAQAHDATIALIQEVITRGVNVREIYVDTVGPPATYQAKLARIFTSCKVTVSKKADSLYPSVSVASIVAKVSRDFALEQYFAHLGGDGNSSGIATGSGYPSDPKTVNWLRESMDNLFGWGSEARFSWSTAADMLKKNAEVVDWPEKDDENADIASLMTANPSNDVKHWFGSPVGTAEL